VANDYGIALSRTWLHGPLATLPPRALRLWLYLAAKSQHQVFTRSLSDGQRVTVHPRQVYTSLRMLKKDPGYRSFTTLSSDLKALTDAGAISCQPVGCSKNRSGGAPEIEAPSRSTNWSANYIVATLITVHGVRELRDRGAPEIGAKREETSGTTSRRRREMEELRAFDAQMLSEGR